jgi:hypothetical protein
VRTTAGRLASGIGGLFFVTTGLWAFVSPGSFFQTVAPWEPYNAHFLRDAGAFSTGLGLGVVAALITRGRISGLVAAAGGASLHAISHVVDHGDGGRTTDPWLLGLLAVVLVGGLLVEWNSER